MPPVDQGTCPPAPHMTVQTSGLKLLDTTLLFSHIRSIETPRDLPMVAGGQRSGLRQRDAPCAARGLDPQSGKLNSADGARRVRGAALMQDQVEGLRRRGVAADYLASTRSDAERSAILADLQQPANLIGLSLLFITPELVSAMYPLLSMVSHIQKRLESA